jgi:23S rRNA (adenine2503-C2)-methyltransferase
LYNRPLTAVEDMHNLPAEIRSALVEDFDCTLAVPSRVSVSQDGTTKMLVKFGDREVVEGVIIPSGDRRTLCISSQVGCALDCRFCATARLGLRRNLEAGEIVSQVLVAREQGDSWPLTNYVFMGMGEPLANYDRLLRALEIMTARWGLGISPRRITVSTVGLVPQLKRLAADTKVHIAISLTAARDDLRDQLMPINRRYPLSELIGACHDLDLPRRKRITFEYVMLDGVNDSLGEADRLVKLLDGLRVKVNLIPFNPFEDCGFNRSPDAVIESFQERLLSAGVHATVRQSRGRDIAAACGQLAAQAS